MGEEGGGRGGRRGRVGEREEGERGREGDGWMMDEYINRER